MAIVDYLEMVPGIDQVSVQHALIARANLDAGLARRTVYTRAELSFGAVLLEDLEGYGRLADGRYALEALIEAARDLMGGDAAPSARVLLLDLRLQLAMGAAWDQIRARWYIYLGGVACCALFLLTIIYALPLSQRAIVAEPSFVTPAAQSAPPPSFPTSAPELDAAAASATPEPPTPTPEPPSPTPEPPTPTPEPPSPTPTREASRTPIPTLASPTATIVPATATTTRRPTRRPTLYKTAVPAITPTAPVGSPTSEPAPSATTGPLPGPTETSPPAEPSPVAPPPTVPPPTVPPTAPPPTVPPATAVPPATDPPPSGLAVRP